MSVPDVSAVSDPSWALGAIEGAAGRIAAIARSGDLSAPAHRLGRWRARDVVAHLGGVHDWAARIVSTRSMDGPGFTKSRLDGEALADWYGTRAGALVAVLAASDPRGVCPNFNPGSPPTVGFWWRRQAHETTVHRWDVERAFDAVTPIDPAIATDGIDEHLDIWVRTRGKHTLAAPLAITATESGRSWTVRPTAKPGRVDVEQGRADDVEAELAGAAADVLLVLWNRLTIDEAGVRVAGDPAVAGSFRPIATGGR